MTTAQIVAGAAVLAVVAALGAASWLLRQPPDAPPVLERVVPDLPLLEPVCGRCGRVGHSACWGQLEPSSATTPPSLTCPHCGKRSYAPRGVRVGYCGHCGYAPDGTPPPTNPLRLPDPSHRPAAAPRYPKDPKNP